MEQYNVDEKDYASKTPATGKARALFDADLTVKELQSKIVTLYMMIEKLRKDNNRIKNELEELRNYVRTHR